MNTADVPQVPIRVPLHPGASSPGVSARMSRAPRRDTAPELALRHVLHAAGLRYRVAYPVPGRSRRTIDIAFTKRKVAVFVDGCFWHGCPQHGTEPASNSEWWRAKLAANKARDLDTTRHLVADGWVVLRFWEHEAPEDSSRQILQVVGPRLLPTVRQCSDPTPGADAGCSEGSASG